jgi:hypothetical protein
MNIELSFFYLLASLFLTDGGKFFFFFFFGFIKENFLLHVVASDVCPYIYSACE